MATTEPKSDNGERYERYSYVLASELRPKIRYCPECGDLEAKFTYEMMVYDGCENHPRARYSCVGCGLIRHFAVVIE